MKRRFTKLDSDWPTGIDEIPDIQANILSIFFQYIAKVAVGLCRCDYLRKNRLARNTKISNNYLTKHLPPHKTKGNFTQFFIADFFH